MNSTLVARLELLEDVGLELGVVADRARISSPSRCDAASTRSASWAGCSRASFGCGTRSRTVGTWPGERLDGRPVEEAARPDRRRKRARHEPPQQPAEADVDADDAIPAFEARELDLVRADEPRAVDVDQLPVEHVLLQQHLLRAALERLQVEPRARSVDAAVLDLRDRVRGDEHLTPGDRREQAGDGRVLVLAEPDDQVVDAADRPPS